MSPVTVLGEHMESEILEQISLLRNNANAYLEQLRQAFQGQSFDQVLLIARGSSDNAALYARYLIEVKLGIPVSLAAPSVLTRYGTRVRYQNCLAVGISQSGAAPDVAEVLSSLRADGHATLGITNTPNSRLQSVAEHTLLLDCGPEKAVAATKTFLCSMAALYQLATALGAEAPSLSDHLPDEEAMDRASSGAREWVPMVVRSSPVFALARGYRFSIAMETALKLMECALIPCKSYSSADFQHGPRALAREESCAIVYGDRVAGLEEQGCIVVKAPAVDAPEEIQPIHDILFGQWLALLCARSRGLNPDQPQHISKVTQTL